MERNFEVAAQCCIDVANWIIALEGAPKPCNYQEALVRLGEIGVLDIPLDRDMALLAGLQNVLVHQSIWTPNGIRIRWGFPDSDGC